jgi:hypothetical protein
MSDIDPNLRVIVEGLSEEQVRLALGQAGLEGFSIEPQQSSEITNDPRLLSSISSAYHYMLKEHFNEFEEEIGHPHSDHFGSSTWSALTRPKSYTQTRQRIPIDIDPARIGLRVKRREDLGLPSPKSDRQQDSGALQVGSLLDFVARMNEGYLGDAIGFGTQRKEFLNALAARLNKQISAANRS